MLIQPTQPIAIVIKVGSEKFDCEMISLSPKVLELSCSNYVEKQSLVLFVARFFRGKALVDEIRFDDNRFIYRMKINEIQFQPGLLINTAL